MAKKKEFKPIQIGDYLEAPLPENYNFYVQIIPKLFVNIKNKKSVFTYCWKQLCKKDVDKVTPMMELMKYHFYQSCIQTSMPFILPDEKFNTVHDPGIKEIKNKVFSSMNSDQVNLFLENYKDLSNFFTTLNDQLSLTIEETLAEINKRGTNQK